MFDLIPISTLIAALGGVVYVVSNHLSEFDENDETDSQGFSFKAKFADWTSKLPLERVKAQSLSLTQKLLRKTRIALLKVDNQLTKLIGKVSQEEKQEEKQEKKIEREKFWEDLANKPEAISESIPEPKSAIKIDLTLKTNPEAEKFFDIKPVKKIVRQRTKRQVK